MWRLLGWDLPVDDPEVHDGLEFSEHAITADDGQLVDEQLVVPRSCVALCPLNWLEVFQVDVDVREVVALSLSLLVHLHDNGESLLPQDLDRVDRREELWHLVHAPLLRLEVLNRVNHALLTRDGVPHQEPV